MSAQKLMGRPYAAIVLALLLALGAVGFAQGGTSKADRKAKKTVKKIGKRIQKCIRAKASDKAIEFIRELERVNHPLAADLVLSLAISASDEDVYEALQGALALMDDPKVAEHLITRWKEPKKKRLKLAWQHKILVLDGFKEQSGSFPSEGVALGLIDAQPAVIRAAVAIASSKEDKRVVSALISLLGKLDKQGGTLYFDARQALVDLTGEDFYNGEKWKSWWDANKAGSDFEKKGKKTEAATVARKKEEIPSFFGTEIKSNRCLFIIDVSGSMKMTDPPAEFGGKIEDFEKQAPTIALQRIERAKKALFNVVQKLQPTQLFNVLRYSSGIEPWKKKAALVPASPANKADAGAFVENLREGGGTETHAALKRAFAYTDVDTIYILSDGAPSTGKLGNPGDQQMEFQKAEIKKILAWLKVANRFRRIKIHSFGFDGPGAWHKKWGPRSPMLPIDQKYLQPFQNFMRRLASDTGGDYKSL